MSKGQEAQTIINIHRIINATWQILKKHIPNMGTCKSRDEWDTILKECEELYSLGKTEEQAELTKAIAIAVYNYIDKTHAAHR